MRYTFLRKTFLYTALALLLFYLMTIAYIKADEASLVFFPNDKYETTPADSGWVFTEEFVKAGPARALYGWKIAGLAADTAAPVILYFGGSAGNISWEMSEFSALRHAASAIYAFDYYGFGRSSGIISEENVLKSAEDAFRWLVRSEQIPAERIVLYGHQLGAHPALVIGSGADVRGVVIESPFTSIPDLANEIYPILPLRQIMSIRMDNLAAVKRLKRPLLVIHSEKDRVIPYQHGKKLYENASGPKKLLLLKSGTHSGAVLGNLPLFLEQFREVFGSR